MTDPLSVTFGVVGTAAVALSAAQKLKSFIDGIEGAPSAIDALSKDLFALSSVLHTLKDSVSNPNLINVHAQARVLRLLEEPLQNCVAVVNLISEKLRPFVKPAAKVNKSKWRGFVWTYREKEFNDLKMLLLSYKSSLEIAISAATLYVTTYCHCEP